MIKKFYITSQCVLVAMMLTFSVTSEAKIKRSAKAKAEFKRQHPCPATGFYKGRCPGYVVDHVDPLCAGGLDEPVNMQWQTLAESKLKDRIERRICGFSHRRF